MDHPAITGILAEILSEPPFRPNDDGTGSEMEKLHPFRLEDSYVAYRPTVEAGEKVVGRSDQNVGTRLGHVVRPPQQANAMRYQVAGGQIYSGLTRVAWELEEVKESYGVRPVTHSAHPCTTLLRDLTVLCTQLKSCRLRWVRPRAS